MHKESVAKKDFKREKRILLGILLLFFIRGILKAYIVWTLGFERTVFGVKDMFPLAQQSAYWMSGVNPLSNPLYYSTEHAYPPLFPITFGILSRISSIPPIKIMLIFSPFSSPLIFLSFYYFISKIIGKEDAFVLSVIFFNAALMYASGGVLLPRVVDWIMFPPLLYFYLRNKKMAFIVFSLILIYQHGLLPLPFIFALLIYSVLYDPEKLRDFALIFLFSTPLIYFIAGSASTYVKFYSTRQVFLGLLRLRWIQQHIILFFGFTAMLYFLINESEHQDLVKISFLWIFSSIPILYFRIFRFFNYITIPLTILGGLMLLELDSIKIRNYLIFISILSGAFYHIESIYELLSVVV